MFLKLVFSKWIKCKKKKMANVFKKLVAIW